MLGTIVSVGFVWAIEVVAALLMYAWVLCKHRLRQAGPALSPAALR